MPPHFQWAWRLWSQISYWMALGVSMHRQLLVKTHEVTKSKNTKSAWCAFLSESFYCSLAEMHHCKFKQSPYQQCAQSITSVDVINGFIFPNGLTSFFLHCSFLLLLYIPLSLSLSNYVYIFFIWQMLLSKVTYSAFMFLIVLSVHAFLWNRIMNLGLLMPRSTVWSA